MSFGPALLILGLVSASRSAVEPDADPLGITLWIATAAAAAGVATGTVVVGLRPRLLLGSVLVRGAAVFLVPVLVVASATLAGPGSRWNPVGPVPDPRGAALAASGLFLVGVACAPWSRRASEPIVAAGLSRTGALLLVAVLADGAAAGWGLLEPRPPWSPEVAARLLDLSPRALVLESGGADWMRHDSVYESVGTDRLGPGIRTGWAGSVAAYLVVVVGCVSAALRCGARSR